MKLRPGHYERAVWIVDADDALRLLPQAAKRFDIPRLVGSTFDRFAVAVT